MKRTTTKPIATRCNATLQRNRFVEEYVKDPDPTQAAIRSGYPRKSARLIGRRLLEDAEVVAAIEQGKAEAAAAADSLWMREVWTLATTPVGPRTAQIKLAALTLLNRARPDVDGRGRRGGGGSRGPLGGDGAESREPGQVILYLPDNGRGDGPPPLPPIPRRNSELSDHSTNDSSGLQTES